MEPSDPTQQTSTSNQQSAEETVPHVWPGIFGVYKYSKAAIRFNLGTNVWLIVFAGLLGGAANAGAREGHNLGAGFIANLLATLFGAAFLLSQIASVRRVKLSLETSLKQALPLWFKYILLSLLVMLTYVVSLLLLIVPFFFIFHRFVLATYLLVDKRMGVLEAYRTSWQVTKGHAAEPWNVIAGTILITLLAVTIIGIPFAIYFYLMYSAALAVYYEMHIRTVNIPEPAQQTPTPPTV